MARNTIGTSATIASVGTTLKRAKTMSPNGSSVPVSFSTMLSGLLCEACDSAMELDRPLAQITQPE